MKQTLRFKENGEFRILVLSDLHFNTVPVRQELLQNITTLVDRENPDLVLFCGDNTDALNDTGKLRDILAQTVSHIEEKKIPWAHVFGNHDDVYLTRAEQETVYEEFAYCLSKAGDPSVPGVGNYVLPVLASEGDAVRFNVWAMDSFREMTSEEIEAIRPVAGAYAGMNNSHYGYIRSSQIKWYYDTSLAMEKSAGGVIPAMMFFHIPLQENYTAWINRSELTYDGEKRESICAGEINSGLFAAVLERGDVKAIVNGHDHNNDYMLEYCGVKLCACATPGTYGYYEADMLGGRVLVVSESHPDDIETYMSYVTPRRDPVDPDDVDDFDGGTVLDFEKTPEYTLVSPNSTGLTKTVSGRGVGGSAAFAITRTAWSDVPPQNNMQTYFTLDKPGKLGECRYIRVYIDLAGDSAEMDFRKASFGLIPNYETGNEFSTDNNDGSFTPFYFLEEGGDEWVKMSHGQDGCFGAVEGSSVKGKTGWFAFPVTDMRSPDNGKKPNPDTVVSGIYFYCALAAENMTGQFVYLDDIALVEDYRVFD